MINIFWRLKLLTGLTPRINLGACASLSVIHPAEEGGYWAEVPSLPGCITEGDTMKEVIANLKDAIEGWLDVANSRHAAEPSDQVVAN